MIGEASRAHGAADRANGLAHGLPSRPDGAGAAAATARRADKTT